MYHNSQITAHRLESLAQLVRKQGERDRRHEVRRTSEVQRT